MPEFILDHGTCESAAAFKALDSFTQGYIEAMFFTSTGAGDDKELEDADLSQLAPETWERIRKDCAAFQEDNYKLLVAAYGHRRFLDPHDPRAYSETSAGADYWFTRNDHGIGYWDRDLGELGEQLAKACRYHEVDLYRGDDGLLYLA